MWETNRPARGTITWSRNGEPARKKAGKEKRLHEVTISGLKPGIQYTYTVEAETESNRVSAEGIFRTLPADSRPFSFVVLGDNRTRPEKFSQVVRAIHRKEEPAFLIHTGDFVTNGKKAVHWQKQFFEPVAPLIQDICLWPVLGNHERNSTHYFEYFSLPGNERWYSIDASDIHFVFMDLYFSDFTPGSEQYEWLKSDLQKTVGRPTVVTFHTPVFSSGPHARRKNDGSFAEKRIGLVRQHLMPLFEKHNVKVVFSGHDHLYERSKKNGIYYIVQGGGGAPLYNATSENERSEVLITGTLCYTVVRVRGGTMDIITRNAKREELDRVSIELK